MKDIIITGFLGAFLAAKGASEFSKEAFSLWVAVPLSIWAFRESFIGLRDYLKPGIAKPVGLATLILIATYLSLSAVTVIASSIDLTITLTKLLVVLRALGLVP